jgi:hypothetical protein
MPLNARTPSASRATSAIAPPSTFNGSAARDAPASVICVFTAIAAERASRETSAHRCIRVSPEYMMDRHALRAKGFGCRDANLVDDRGSSPPTFLILMASPTSLGSAIPSIITEQNSELCEQGAARLASSQPQIYGRALSLVAGSQSSWSRDIDLNKNCVPYRLVSKHRGRTHPRLAMAL